MSLCRLLLLRSIRRYSSASNPFPFHSPSAGQTFDYPSQYDHHNQSNNYHNSQFTATGGPNYRYDSQTPDAADSSYYQRNPQDPIPGSNYQHNPSNPIQQSSYSQHNPPPQSSYSQHNPLSQSSYSLHNPPPQSSYSQYNPPPQSSNYYQSNPPPQSSYSLHNPPPQSSYSQHNPPPQSSNYYQSNPYLNTHTDANNPQFPSSAAPFVPQRSHGFSSAEEAAAERRRRKRRQRIEPPLHALRPNPPPRALPDDPSKPRLPDSTNVLVGPRLNLHNRVQSLIRAGDLDGASYVARQAAYSVWSLRTTVFTCNAIIAAMGRAGRNSDAQALFHYFFRQFDIIPNVVSYNSLILSHCDSGQVDEALSVYRQMLEHAPFSPSSFTFRHLTKGLVQAGRIDDAVSMLREMIHKGQGADSLVFNNVILGFLNLGQLDKANELFDELRERCAVYDGTVSATFIDWFFKQGKPKEAMEAYRDLLSRNYIKVPASRNVILETLLRHGRKKEAWDMFHVMLDEHTPPTFMAVNSDTVNMMVNECFKEGNIEEAVDVFKRCGKGVKSKPFQMDVPGYNNMMMRLCELGMVDEAEKYFTQLTDKSLSPDVNSFKTMIEAYIKADRLEKVLEKFVMMVEVGTDGLRVIPPYANKWFGYLIEKGSAVDCLPILSKMASREPKPDVTTYEVVTRGLVQGGEFDAVLELLRDMAGHGVGVSASLKEFVVGAFGGVNRLGDIESVLSKFQSQFVPQRPHLLPRGPQLLRSDHGGWNREMPHANGSVEHGRQPESMPQQELEFHRVAGQNAA
ncbi:Pentatricopeptide repeat-containing protein [Striga hermonthica]|uniref:Pentatricopeptide repeat-containing protein n=1 Tax=Striga hermonthica TaxID=68872 RepID=A0A9N7MTS3_STRHE|nr:Pentatricopeptide repeat-containing protein [Striga hermonthica]